MKQDAGSNLGEGRAGNFLGLGVERRVLEGQVEREAEGVMNTLVYSSVPLDGVLGQVRSEVLVRLCMSWRLALLQPEKSDHPAPDLDDPKVAAVDNWLSGEGNAVVKRGMVKALAR